MGKITFKVVGNGQLYVEKNRFPVGTAIPNNSLSGIDFQTGDSLGMILIPYTGSYVISLCDFPQTECRTESSYYFDITNGNALPQMMIANFSTAPPPPVTPPVAPPPTGSNSIVNTSVSGTNVTLSVSIGTSDVKNWWLRITSKYDYGYGKGQGMGDYPWIVDIIESTAPTYSATKTYKPGLYVAELNIMGKGPVDFSTFELTAPVVAPKATIFNWCWKVGLAPGSCILPRDAPAITAGSSVVIQADIANSGGTGKVRCILKADGSQIVSQENASLVAFPTGPLWSVRTTYTMPNKNVGLTVEAYSWNGSTWVLTDTRTDTISMSAPACSNVSLDPFSAFVDPNNTATHKVILTATTLPTGTSFPVTFKSDSGTVLGTCSSNSTTGKCTFTWDYNTQKNTTPDVTYGDGSSGYNIIAVVGSPGTVGACTSNKTIISVGSPIVQYTFSIIVHDKNTGEIVPGATVLAAISGSPSQTKVTDTSGTASFIVDSGTVSVTITKDGYNLFTTAEYVFNNKTVTYLLIPTPVVPTTGGIEFVSVPPNATIYLDGKTAPLGNTPFTVDGLSAGSHSFILMLAGYNDLSGSTIVQSGSTVSVYVSMPIATPESGSVNITSHPVMGAKIYIDGKDMLLTTSASALITDIPPGNHSFKLVLDGYKDATGDFGVNAGLTTYIDEELFPLTTIGSLEITSNPSGAKVYIDDKDTGKYTPASVLNLAVGNHSYKLTMSGYQDATGKFTIIAGTISTADVILTGVPETTGNLQITSNPSNAKVLIDGKDVNKVTPAIVSGLTEGNHTYLLKLTGYKDFGAIVMITAGHTKTIDVPLELGAGTGTGAGAGALALMAAGVIAFGVLASKK